jgi:hypothetical protein
MFAIEITAATNAGGTLATFYLADGLLVTEASDTPASFAFDRSLLDPGSISVTAFGDGRTSGGTRLSLGEIRLANSDGQYDGWLAYGFDGRPVVIRSGEADAAYPSAWSAVFTGTIEALTVNRKEVVIRLRDKQLIFDRPVLTEQYGGTNVLPNGIDGTADDLAGKAKPRLLGSASNIAPPCVNTSKLVYQITTGALASIGAVYDRGAALIFGVDHSTSGALVAATVDAGEYDTCLAEGLFRLGSAPSGEITCDAVQGAAAVDRTASAMLLTLALAAGVSAGDINGADVAALAADNTATLGIWISGQSDTYARVMDQIAGTVGGYYAFDPNGVLRMGRLTEPGGTSVLDLQEFDVLEPFERRPARDGDLPTWAVTVRHSRVGTVQTSDLAGAVTQARRAVIGQEWRSQRAENAAVRAQFLLAAETTFDTLFTDATAAADEASRRQALYGVHRDLFEVGVPVESVGSTSVWLMDAVTLTHPRFGLSAGRQFRLLGIRPDLAKRRFTLTLWG